MKRAVDFASIALVVLALIWVSIPSSAFIRQVSLSVTNGTVQFVRELPLGEVSARWWSEITLIDGEEFECNSGLPQMAFYQHVAGNTVRYGLGEWAQPCLESGPPFYLTTHRQVMLFGIIPLRPSRAITKIEGERVPVNVLVVPLE